MGTGKRGVNDSSLVRTSFSSPVAEWGDVRVTYQYINASFLNPVRSFGCLGHKSTISQGGNGQQHHDLGVNPVLSCNVRDGSKEMRGYRVAQLVAYSPYETALTGNNLTDHRDCEGAIPIRVSQLSLSLLCFSRSGWPADGT